MTQSDEGRDDDSAGLLALTAGIIEAYLGKNGVGVVELPGLIQSVHGALRGLGAPAAPAASETPKATAAAIRKSVTPEALISFEDGRPYKTLKRHLTTRGLTIGDYKAKWGLPDSYPSTAPQYSAQRSAMAKQLGLGRPASAPKTKGKAAAAKAPAAKSSAAKVPAKATRGSRKS